MPSKPKKSKRFKYNLETVLTVRNIREKQEQDAFNAAQRKLEEEIAKEQALRDTQNHEYQELHDLMASGDIGNLAEMQRRKLHLEILEVKIQEQVTVREDAEKAKEEQREKLIQAVKERRIIERDKENKRIAWRKLMDKEAGKFLDDISSVKFAKKKMALEE